MNASKDETRNSYPKVEILSVNELDALPEGVCVLSKDSENSGSEAIGYFILGSIRAKSEKRQISSILLDEAHRRERSPQYLIGQICANYKYSGIYQELVDEINTAFPNLCWFRGGDYLETDNGAPALTNYLQLGANGLLGDIRAINYAKKNYNSEIHRNPVLYMIPLRSLIRVSMME